MLLLLLVPGNIFSLYQNANSVCSFLSIPWYAAVQSRRTSTRSGATASRSTASDVRWVMVRYGEFDQRVGKMQKLSTPGLEVCYRDEGATPAHDPASRFTLNLKTLRNRDRVEGVEARQKKIGRGFMLWRKSYQSVWLYNRSKYAVYVQSPTLAHPSVPHRVHKVPSGRSLKIFDRARAAQVKQWYDRCHGGVPGTLDLHSCRISMTSGWGQDNPRHQTLLDCHCWLEVYFTFPDEMS